MTFLFIVLAVGVTLLLVNRFGDASVPVLALLVATFIVWLVGGFEGAF